MNKETSWSKLFEYREQIHKMYRDIWDMKILRKRFPLMVRMIGDGEKILDIGASNRNLEKRLKRHFPNLIYKSMDIDREQVHDFYSMEEIRETFDVVFLFEVIEHLELEESAAFAEVLRSAPRRRTLDPHHPQYLQSQPVLEGCHAPGGLLL